MNLVVPCLGMALCLAFAWSSAMAKAAVHLKAREIVAQESRLADGLDEVDRDIATLVAQLTQTQDERRTQLKTITALDRNLSDVEEKIDSLKQRIEERLRHRARMNLDEVAWRRLLLSKLESNRILRTRGYVASILKSDLQLLDTFSDQVVNLGKLKGEKAEALAALRSVEAQLKLKRAALEEERNVKSEVIRVLRSETRLLRALAKTRTRQRNALKVVDASGGRGLTPQRGRLPMPSSGAIAIPYGPRRDGEMKTTVFSNGWAIDAPSGSPVRTIADGDVVFSGWYAGFGNLVIVDHGAGHHTLYAHLQSIRKVRGEQVRQGDLLGEVGETGSLRGPHLYFELRIRKRPVNPRYWIE